MKSSTFINILSIIIYAKGQRYINSHDTCILLIRICIKKLIAQSINLLKINSPNYSPIKTGAHHILTTLSLKGTKCLRDLKIGPTDAKVYTQVGHYKYRIAGRQ